MALAIEARLLPTRLGDVVLGQAEIAMEPFVRAGLLDRIEVLALEVLDQREFEHLSIARLANDGRGLGELKLTRGAPPTLTGDQFVFVADLSDDQRLDDATLTNAFDQLLQVLAAKLLPRLKGARRDLVQGKWLDALAKLFDG